MIIEIAIPIWPVIACPMCTAVAVNLDGDLVCCSVHGCVAGDAFRCMVERQQVEATRRLRNLHKHVIKCAYCQRANDRRGACLTGAALWGRWFAWLIPGPNDATPGPT